MRTTFCAMVPGSIITLTYLGPMHDKVNDKVCREYVDTFPTGVEVKNESRIKFMLSHSIIGDKLDEWIKFEVDEDDENIVPRNELIPFKNEEYSVKKREEGNLYFKRKSFMESILCYNEALQFTPLKTKENQINAALCFGNRSAAYYELGTREEKDFKKFLKNSLSDSIHCLHYGYPEKLKLKILLRQVNIYLKLGHIEKANESFQASCGYQEISKEAQLKIKQLQTELKIFSSQKTQQEDDGAQDSNKLDEFKENPSFAGASEVLTLHCSEDKGRYVKCNRKVKFGQILFKETPFASVLLPSYYDMHCFHCHCHLDNNLYFFPCSDCSQVKFCSENCYKTAWDIYHKHECGYLDFLHSVGIGHLATRIILIAGKQESMKAASAENIDSLLSVKVFEKGQQPYQRVLTLLDHINVMRVEDLFQYSLTASLLTHFLKTKTSFFDETSQEDIYKIGGMLLKHICQLICNANAVTFIASDYRMIDASTATSEESQQRIASAIYSSSSMMNHSCEPNIASSFHHGRTLIIKTVQDCDIDSEISNCYGPFYRRFNRCTRQEMLAQQYFFSCDCSACKRELEEGHSFVDRFSALKCDACDGPIAPDLKKKSFMVQCIGCDHRTHVEESMHGSIKIGRMITAATQKLDGAQAADALNILLKAKEMCEQYLYEFNADFGKVNDSLARCYSILGNFDAAIPYLEASTRYVLERFGESSIEYARELKKLGELYLRSSDKDERDEAQEKIERANEILILYC